MADGQQKPPKRRWLRPSAPHLDGPLASSGAAPEQRPDTTRESDAGTAGARPDAGQAAASEPGTSGLSTSAADTNGPETSAPESGTSGLKPDEPGAGGTGAARDAGKSEITGGPGDGAAPADKTPGGSATAAAEDKAEGKTPEKPPGTDTPVEKTEDKAEGKTEGKTEDKAGGKTDGKAGDKADGKIDGEAGGGGKKDEAAPSAAALAAASKGRATRVLRSANPVRVARNTARSTSAWAKRPSGRLIVPAVIALLLLGGAGAAGAYLVPKALQSVPSPAATPGFGADGGASGAAAPGGGSAPGSASAPAVGGIPPAPPVGGVVGAARPADALSGWAQQTGTRAGIPVVAVQAYGYAELVVGRTTPACHLSWTTIAAIAKVESAHGSANGAVLSVDGSVAPAILGLPLDGKGGRQLVRDSDQGLLDGDTQFDRALGPLQFIPQTWAAISVGNGADADNNGVSDPNDIDDASLAAARYLCQNGRDLSKPDAWWDAILSYNAVRPYAQKVFDAANDYGQRSKV